MAKNSPLFIDIGPGLSMMLGFPTIASWNNKSKPKKPNRGTLGFNVDTNHLEYWDGSSWFVAKMS